ncbi:CBS domain-containing protein [Vibrio parahaemolyticus]|uniref:DUF294 nucleotidyltransferase-like domain-containing protein n=7 Tax=Vibrio parahaemolyticus TaxID=670 RepID=UPI0002A5AF3D|nr:DUF294 nucleotidyltransferase-like domain-containing protein [Vibrio parahaemolyticus]AGB10686.1 putative signal-transduction protein containing cAMP-binding and CBS domains [Vibrio parahaemolyticus BB22OP]EGR0437529.1 CBS domain-containing protein [Vibrio parahaemolyticus]EGR2566240.1 CBS domain-containing protein [Vibrio parahaemolyticus]EGR3327969.1 CBS domain-containing protein [Vibrio parahaemolyticus]EJG1273060.1 CBS domain-containing protein [Vibrio parahaemolyticus]
MDSTLLPNVVSFFKTIEPFHLLPDHVLDAIATNTDIVYWGKGESVSLVMPEGKNLYIIRAGVIEQRFPNGELRARLGENDVFGFNLEQDKYKVKTIENCLIYKINYAFLLKEVSNFENVVNQVAIRASQRLTSSINAQYSQVEKSLFFKSAKDLANHNVVVVHTNQSIQQVAQIMSKKGCTCALVTNDNALVGVVTETDMTSRVVAEAFNIYRPVEDIMNAHPQSVDQNEPVISALNLMMKHNIRNIPVLDKNKQVLGLISPQELVQRHGIQAVFLIEKISKCNSLESLSLLVKERQAVFEAMIESHLPANVIGQVLMMIYDAFTCRLIKLAERNVGLPPCNYAWLAAGSHARGEVHLGSDQDNALVLDDSATESDRIYFRHFAMYICKGLAECGYPLCKGRFMAATPKWNQPLFIWKQLYRKWANNPEYNMLLNLNVFLEVRFISGDRSLFDELNSERERCTKNNPHLIAALVRNLISHRPPLGIFNNLVLENNGHNEKSLNIKKSAIGLLVDIARIYALHKGGGMLSTEERFDFAYDTGLINSTSHQDLIGTYRYVTQLRYSHQLQCLQGGKPVTNAIFPEHFGSFERQHLKDAFRIIRGYQDTLKMKFGS